jgi:hypothetical protein
MMAKRDRSATKKIQKQRTVLSWHFLVSQMACNLEMELKVQRNGHQFGHRIELDSLFLNQANPC